MPSGPALPSDVPSFDSAELNRLVAAFHRRGRSIRYSGPLNFEGHFGSDGDWVRIVHLGIGRARLVFDIADNLAFELYIVCDCGKFAGRTLMTISGGVLLDEPQRVVEAFKETKVHLPRDADASIEEQPAARIRKIWQAVAEQE